MWLLCLMMLTLILGLIAMLYSSYEENENLNMLVEHYRELYRKDEKELEKFRRGFPRIVIEEIKDPEEDIRLA